MVINVISVLVVNCSHHRLESVSPGELQERSAQVRPVRLLGCLGALWCGTDLTVPKKMFLQTVMEPFGVLTT